MASLEERPGIDLRAGYMTDYTKLFDEDLISLELSVIYFNELLKCKTEEERKYLWEVYAPIDDKVFKREMAQENILTEY